MALRICYQRLVLGLIASHLMVALFAQLNIYSLEMRIFALLVYIWVLAGSFVLYVTDSSHAQRNICVSPVFPFFPFGIYLLLTGIFYVLYDHPGNFDIFKFTFYAQALLGLWITAVSGFGVGYLLAYTIRGGLHVNRY